MTPPSERPSDEWRTPPEFYARLDREFRFGLDVGCRSTNCLAPCGICADAGYDALSMSWSRVLGAPGGTVWLNPPYSRIRPWLAKAAHEAAQGVVVVALVPSDTGTRWWRELVAMTASDVRFVVGRMRFLRPDGGSHYTGRGGGGMTTPSAVVVYSPAGGPPRYSYITSRVEDPRQQELPVAAARSPAASP